MIYSVLEQHLDGAWWYHPWCPSFDNLKEAKAEAERRWPDRPHMVFEHDKPMFDEYSTYTFDFQRFNFSGHVLWTKENGAGEWGFINR